jgi:hypothetical protein
VDIILAQYNIPILTEMKRRWEIMNFSTLFSQSQDDLFFELLEKKLEISAETIAILRNEEINTMKVLTDLI